MTEEEWFACEEPTPMLVFLWNGTKPVGRKLTLFGCACCYRIWHLLLHEWSRNAVEAAEHFTEGRIDEWELESARESARLAFRVANHNDEPFASAPDLHGSCLDAAETAWGVTELVPEEGWALMQFTAHMAREASGTLSEGAAQLTLLRDIFGNPFRPVSLNSEWLTSDVLALARGIYDDRAFDRMPILADALQDAGCDNDAILSHCRDPQQVHVRGCWVVDLLLGKS